jgi:ABC-type polysaccharide transport system permease subunit
MRSEWELGTALGFFKSIVGLFFVLTSNWVIKKLSDDEYGIL